jgi:hypothetical protein
MSVLLRALRFACNSFATIRPPRVTFTTSGPSFSKPKSKRVVAGSDGGEMSRTGLVLNDDIMTQLYKQSAFVTEVLSCCFGREVELVGAPRPQDLRALRPVASRNVGRVTLDAFATYRFRGQSEARSHARVAIHHRISPQRSVIEAQGRSENYVYQRARLHSNLDGVDAMVEETNCAVSRGKAKQLADVATEKCLPPLSIQPSIAFSSDVKTSTSDGVPVGDPSLRRQYDAFLLVPSTAVVTLCNFVGVHVRTADAIRAASAAGADAVSIDQWVEAQDRVSFSSDGLGLKSDESCLEITAANLWRSKDGKGTMCIQVYVQNVSASQSQPVQASTTRASSRTAASSDSQPLFEAALQPAAGADPEDTAPRIRARWLVEIPVLGCAPAVEVMRPLLVPWLSAPTGVPPVVTRGAAYIHDTSQLVFVHLPVLAGPQDASVPLNLWCDPANQSAATAGILSRPPGWEFGGPYGDEIPLDEAAGRLHRLAVLLRSKLSAIPQEILQDPKLGE